MRSYFPILMTFTAFSSFSSAETHGGVERSNAAFKAVLDHALADFDSLSRIFEIKKLINSGCEKGEIFQVTLGGMNHRGIENAYEPIYFLATPDEGPQVLSNFTVRQIKSASCP